VSEGYQQKHKTPATTIEAARVVFLKMEEMTKEEKGEREREGIATKARAIAVRSHTAWLVYSFQWPPFPTSHTTLPVVLVLEILVIALLFSYTKATGGVFFVS